MSVSREDLAETFNLMFNDVPLTSEEEVAAAEYDQAQAEKSAEVHAALSRFISGTSSMADTLLLEKSALIEAIYRSDEDDDAQRPIGFRLRKIDGDIYSDQVGIEAKPGRL